MQALQDRETAARYCRLMFRIVVGLLRHDRQGACPQIATFPPALSSALADLQRSFSGHDVDEDEVMIHLHTVFCELFLVEARSLASEKDLPLVQYLIFCMLDYEGTFKSLQEVRHLTAILTYWCRLVVYVEITKQDWDVQR